jgi:hypothetical protein
MFDIVITDSKYEYQKVYIDNFSHDEVYGHSIQTAAKGSDRTRFVMVLNFNDRHKITHGVIAHEALHITSFILDYVNQDFDHNNHECFTYLCQWITDQVYTFLDKHNLKPSLKALSANKILNN